MTITRSPYINNPDILFCHEARSTRPVALDFGEAEMLPAGTLISCEGKAVNDLTALGVLLYDVWKGYGSGQGVVLISGHVDLAKAQENCGQTYSSEAKAALKGICFVGDTEVPSSGTGGGVTSWNDLQDKPFGEETATIIDNQTFTTDPEQEFFVLSETQLIEADKTYDVIYNGVEYKGLVASEHIADGVSNVIMGNSLIAGGEDTGEPFIVVFEPNGGTGLMPLDGVTVCTLTIIGEVVTPLDSKYLPNGGKSVMYVDVSYSTTKDNVIQGLETSKTFNEILTAYSEGREVKVRLVSTENSAILSLLSLTRYIPNYRFDFGLIECDMTEGAVMLMRVRIGFTNDGSIDGTILTEIL